MNNEIVKKFGIEKYDKKLILNKPADIADFDGISFDIAPNKGKYDLIFAFIFSLDEFVNLLKTVIDKNMLYRKGILYFAYPKKGNKQYSAYIGRDDFFGVIDMNNEGYVYDSLIKFNKMAAFSDVFTVIGMKHDEARKKSPQPSQHVADYVDRIPDVRNRFKENKEILSAFDQLMPGYQRGWARYVFCVKNAATTEKRFTEMEETLRQGYKSIDLYRQHNPRKAETNMPPSKPKTVDEYIAAAAPGVKGHLMKLRAAVLKVAPQATETISYDMPAYRFNGISIYFGGFAKHASLFPGPIALMLFKNELADYKISAGTIQFPVNKQIPVALVKRIVKFRLKIS